MTRSNYCPDKSSNLHIILAHPIHAATIFFLAKLKTTLTCLNARNDTLMNYCSYLWELLFQALVYKSKNTFSKSKKKKKKPKFFFRSSNCVFGLFIDFCHLSALSEKKPVGVAPSICLRLKLSLRAGAVFLSLPTFLSQCEQKRAPHTFQKTDTHVMLGPPLPPSSSHRPLLSSAVLNETPNPPPPLFCIVTPPSNLGIHLVRLKLMMWTFK